MKSIPLAFSLLLANLTMAQNGQRNVPESILNTFQVEFPNATNINWQEQADMEWEVDFKEKGKEKEALFTREGELSETEVEITIDEVPQNIKDYTSQNYGSYEIDDVASITYADGRVNYELELEIHGNDEDLELLFDSNGNFIRAQDEDIED